MKRALISGISGQDEAALAVAFQKAWPDEVYNLAGQVFLPPSWKIPTDTFDTDPGLIQTEFGWKPEVEFPDLVRMMLRADIEALK